MQAGLVLHHETQLSPPAFHRTAAPERHRAWSMLPDAVGDAQLTHRGTKQPMGKTVSFYYYWF